MKQTIVGKINGYSRTLALVALAAIIAAVFASAPSPASSQSGANNTPPSVQFLGFDMNGPDDDDKVFRAGERITFYLWFTKFVRVASGHHRHRGRDEDNGIHQA